MWHCRVNFALSTSRAITPHRVFETNYSRQLSKVTSPTKDPQRRVATTTSMCLGWRRFVYKYAGPRDTRGLGLFPGLIKRIHILANTAWRSTELSSVLRGSTQCLPLILSGSGLGAHRVSHIHQVAFNTTTTTTTTHTYLQSHLHGEAVAVSVRPRERGQPISLSTGASGRPVQSSPGEWVGKFVFSFNRV